MKILCRFSCEVRDMIGDYMRLTRSEIAEQQQWLDSWPQEAHDTFFWTRGEGRLRWLELKLAILETILKEQ